MSRTSKRAIRTTGTENSSGTIKADISQHRESSFVPSSRWRAGIYARLSVDSRSRKNESIDTQIEIAKAYITQFGDMEVVDCYTDLGRTGTNFDRQGFGRMMEDVRRGRINCVAVKDFSRLGRNYIETGDYMEKIFPLMNVRFISVSDGYDSIRGIGGNDYVALNLKNIVNELYAKDIGVRVKVSKKLKREMGSYVGGIPPYGYHTEKNDRKIVLVPEEETRDIVLELFQRFVSGSTYREMISMFYGRRIQPPMEYRRTGQVICPLGEPCKQWSIVTVRGILANPVYVGRLSLRERTHEPLVPDNLFYRAAKRLESQRKDCRPKEISKTVPIREDLFQGMVHCGQCGCRMRRSTGVKTLVSGDKARWYFYSCPGRERMGDKVCTCPGISGKRLLKVVDAVLDRELAFWDIKEGGKKVCGEEGKENCKMARDLVRGIYIYPGHRIMVVLNYRRKKCCL